MDRHRKHGGRGVTPWRKGCGIILAVVAIGSIGTGSASEANVESREGAKPEKGAVDKKSLKDEWAYQPRREYPIPTGIDDGRQASNPIDAFIEQKLEAKDLESAPKADKRTLIRRASYDLTGLPPSPDEVKAFQKDNSADAFAELVDRLLASPQYGEQWGQHWLDVVRYADTAGFANDFERPNAWRYRDYVIRSFNQDKPYDRFVTEQLAGDELNADDPEMLIATGFLRMGPWEHTGMAVKAVTRQQYLDDVTHSIGVTFLAQGLRCAKCHDHKFDPIRTRDYYRMQAVFAPVQFADREAAFLPSEDTSRFQKRAQRLEESIQEAKETIDRIDRAHEKAVAALLKEKGVESVSDLPEDERPKRHYGLTTKQMGLKKISRKRIQRYRRSLHRFDPYAFSVYNGPLRSYRSNHALHPMPDKTKGEVQEVHVLKGGSLKSPGKKVRPGVLRAVQQPMPKGAGKIPKKAKGRRLALARWITHPDNPLTARVIVNRVWQYHFGNQGLVRTPNNFGEMGQYPTHPKLLDWLANWLIAHDWSLKALHRLIMTSSTYQRSYDHPNLKAVREVDPKNKLLAHFPVRRLTAEELRDTMLSVSGELNPRMGGPGIFPEITMQVALQPRHVMGTVAPPYQPSPKRSQRHRRSIYAYRERNLANPMLKVFNRPDPGSSCPRRDETTVATQAFSLFNGQFSHDRALAMAKRLVEARNTPESCLKLAYELCYGREPTSEETELMRGHLAEMKAYHRENEPKKTELPTTVTREMIEELTGEPFKWEERLDVLAEGYERDLKPWEVDATTRAWKEICLVLMNSNELIYLE